MKKDFLLSLSLAVFLLPMMFILTACNNNQFSIVGDWNGYTTISKSATITCEEYETLEGDYVGKKISNESHKMYLVDGISKDLSLTYNGLVEKETQLYLGTNFTYTYVLKDRTTGDISYSSDEVDFYEYGACFDRLTRKFIGIYSRSYEQSYSITIYVIDGKEYTSNEVACYSNVYFDKETNLYLGSRYNFDEVRTYYVGDKIFQFDEIYILNSMSSSNIHEDWFSGNRGYCYVEKDTLCCYKVDEVVDTYGYEYETGIYANGQVKQIKRECLGEEKTSINAKFGDGFAQIKIIVDLKYNYDKLEGLTYQTQDSSETIYYRGYYGLLDDITFLKAEQYSNDGNRWYDLDYKYPRKFEFIVKNKGLQFFDKSTGYSLYEDVNLVK